MGYHEVPALEVCDIPTLLYIEEAWFSNKKVIEHCGGEWIHDRW